MAHLAAMPNKNNHSEHDISLLKVYVEVELLKNKVANQDDKLNEILSISKENQEKLKSIDNVRNTFKTSWKYILILIFVSFMLGLAVDNEAVVKKIYTYFTLS